MSGMPSGFDLAAALQRLNGNRAFFAVLAQVIEALERVVNTFAPPAAAANASASAIVALLAEYAVREAALNRLDFVAALVETRRWRNGASALSVDTPDFTAAACDEPESKRCS